MSSHHGPQIRVLNIVTGLGRGGAEMMLCKVIEKTQGGELDHEVISLTAGGALADRVRDAGAPVRELDWNRSRISPGQLWSLARLIRRTRPDIVQTWMYHADVVGAVAARLAGARHIVWNLQNGTLPRDVRLATRLTMRVAACLSWVLPKRIVVCSRRGIETHAGYGYRRRPMTFIPNGVDTNVFRPQPKDATTLETLNAELPAILIGMVARFDPQKDFGNFLDAAVLIKDGSPDAHFVLCGDLVEPTNEELVHEIVKRGLAGSVSLLGPRTDVRGVLSILDVFVLSSRYGEGLPNAVAEAMACGIPCVVTDVGDTADLVGAAGAAVPASDPAALAREVVRLASSPETRGEMSKAGRARIQAHYALEDVVEQYATLYREVSSGG